MYAGVQAARDKWRASVDFSTIRGYRLLTGGLISQEIDNAFSRGAKQYRLGLGCMYETPELAGRARSKFLLLLGGKAADDCPLTPAEEEETRRDFKSADDYLVWLRKQAAVAKLTKRGSSKYKGVDWNQRSERWQARIRINGKQKTLGHYRSEEEAARVVDDAIRARDGAAAITNLSFSREGVPEETILLRTLQRHSDFEAAPAEDAGGDAFMDARTSRQVEERPALTSSRRRKRSAMDDGSTEPAPSGGRREKRTPRSTASGSAASDYPLSLEAPSLPTPVEEEHADLVPGSNGAAEPASWQPMASHQQGDAPAGRAAVSHLAGGAYESDDDSEDFEPGCPELIDLSSRSKDNVEDCCDHGFGADSASKAHG